MAYGHDILNASYNDKVFQTVPTHPVMAVSKVVKILKPVFSAPLVMASI